MPAERLADEFGFVLIDFAAERDGAEAGSGLSREIRPCVGAVCEAAGCGMSSSAHPFTPLTRSLHSDGSIVADIEPLQPTIRRLCRRRGFGRVSVRHVRGWWSARSALPWVSTSLADLHALFDRMAEQLLHHANDVGRSVWIVVVPENDVVRRLPLAFFLFVGGFVGHRWRRPALRPWRQQIVHRTWRFLECWQLHRNRRLRDLCRVLWRRPSRKGNVGHCLARSSKKLA